MNGLHRILMNEWLLIREWVFLDHGHERSSTYKQLQMLFINKEFMIFMNVLEVVIAECSSGHSHE